MDWTYPRGEVLRGQTVLFLQVPERLEPWTSGLVRWHGMVLIDHPSGIISLSRTDLVILEGIPRLFSGSSTEVRFADLLFLLLSHSLDALEDLVQLAEVKVAGLERGSVRQQPEAF